MKIPSRNWRTYSTLKRTLPAKVIRNRFLDYFIKENDHHFIKSSPVLPKFDPSIPFVNAGMCQFKRVFTGEEKIEYERVANSQKCIRVGGKHNDSKLVGHDSFHHSFFEMLGNWSFGSYSKKQACSFAWEFLTTPPFSIPPHRLFFTYFGGDKELNLEADLEVREIWLELGVKPERILPFSTKENFWEMGLTGPCGICTEIHVALTDELGSRQDLVNVNHPLLAELWNIVFIEFNKTEDGIEKLPLQFIDTGMGFERLVSLLQHKTSNYDTDLFQPLFRTIENVTKCPPYAGSFGVNNLDYAFRRLADFSRMITVAIADDVFPDIHSKLRRILRKALYIANNKFKQESPEILLVELARRVADSLSETYPEIGANLEKVKLIIEDEALLLDNLAIANEFTWKNLNHEHPYLQKFSFLEYAGLPEAHKYLKSVLKKSTDESKAVSALLVLKLYNTYGLDRSVVEQLAPDMNFTVDWDAVERALHESTTRSKNQLTSEAEFESILRQLKVRTDHSWKHKCKRVVDSNGTATYTFPEIEATIVALLRNKKLVSISSNEKLPEELKTIENAEVSLQLGESIGLIFDKTNFSHEISGRRFDRGYVTVNGKRFYVGKLDAHHDFIVHHATSEDNESVTIKTGDSALLQLDSVRRLNIMRNNVLTHLMLFTLRDMFPLVYLQYDNTEDAFANIRLCVHGSELNLKETAEKIQKLFRTYIKESLPVEKSVVLSKSDLLQLPGLKLRPCWSYPSENIELISIVDKEGNVVVREPSSDVHVHNTADLEDCCILYIEKVGEHILSVNGFTGTSSSEVIVFNEWIESQADIYGKRVDVVLEESCPFEKVLEVSEDTQVILYELLRESEEKKFWVSLESQRLIDCMNELEFELSKRVNQIPIKYVLKYVKTNMNKQAKNQKCVVYFNLLNVDDFKMREFVTRFIRFENLPVLFLTYMNRKLRAYCNVPQDYCTSNFDAEIWLQHTLDEAGFSFQVVTDESSYPGFSFISHVMVRPYQIDRVRKVVLTEGVNIANTMLK